MKNKVFYLLVSGLLCFNAIKLSGQITAPVLPIRTATLNAIQELNFGDLSVKPGSSGGTVTVNYDGTRTATSEVVLLNMGHIAQQAIFEFKLCPGRTVTITYPTVVSMIGINGGTLTLHIGPILVGSTIIDYGSGTFTSNKGCDSVHLIYAGGTIDVGSILANPSGSYNVSFQITITQQ